MFVDDNTLMHNTPCPSTSAEDLMENVQHNAELWERLLWVTGGLLEFLKSSYFLVIWKFTTKGKPDISLNLPPNKVHLTDANGSSTKLKRVQQNDRIEMLGVHKVATLQETTEKNHLHKKLGCFIKAIRACPLKAHIVWLCYITVLISSITYHLACTLFTDKNFSSFHKRLML
eukprot:7583996-Ditylum_brightwellii.AAC.1